MSVDLRGLLLRLLREDEEFRLAVMGLLGYSDVKSSVDRLVEAVNELTKLAKAHDERLARLENAVEELTKAIRAHEERLTKVEERLTRLENAIEELTKVVKAHEDRLTKVEDRLSRLENAVEELTKAVKAHEERLTRLENAIEELTKAVRSHEERLTRIERKMVNVERRLSRIERTLDNITISLEDEANYMVQYLLKQRGIVVKTNGIFFDSRYEFDIYGSDGDVTVIGEVKSRASPRTVQRLVNKVRRVMGKWPERFKGKVIIVLYCLRALPGTVEEAVRQSVWLMEDLEERTKPNI
jgi:predicted RNase H-like nuclease (RuvC/YqgF family)